MTSSQISEWQAYDKIDPIGEARMDFHFASLSSLIVNLAQKIHGKKGRNPKNTTALDFIPNWLGEKQPEKKQSVDEMKQFLLGIARVQNEKVLKIEEGKNRKPKDK